MRKVTVLLLTISLLLTVLIPIQTETIAFDARSAADVNTDGRVNILDLISIAAHFDETPIGDSRSILDINRDGTINILDLTLAASYFGKTSGIPLEATDETFDIIVLESGLPTVVEFKSEFCLFCQLMKPIVSAVALEHRDTFTIAKLDVNTHPQKTDEYRIRATPTYIVFRSGEIIGSFRGAMVQDKFVQRITAILETD